MELPPRFKTGLVKGVGNRNTGDNWFILSFFSEEMPSDIYKIAEVSCDLETGVTLAAAIAGLMEKNPSMFSKISKEKIKQVSSLKELLGLDKEGGDQK